MINAKAILFITLLWRLSTVFASCASGTSLGEAKEERELQYGNDVGANPSLETENNNRNLFTPIFMTVWIAAAVRLLFFG